MLGAYEVAANGDFANWKTAGRKGGGIGGAMDLAASAGRVFVMMDHTTRDDRPRLLLRCTLPLTAPAVVTLVFTDVGVFEPGDRYEVCSFKGMTVGLLICYDIEFPETARAVASLGADLLIVTNPRF